MEVIADYLIFFYGLSYAVLGFISYLLFIEQNASSGQQKIDWKSLLIFSGLGAFYQWTSGFFNSFLVTPLNVYFLIFSIVNYFFLFQFSLKSFPYKTSKYYNKYTQRIPTLVCLLLILGILYSPPTDLETFFVTTKIIFGLPSLWLCGFVFFKFKPSNLPNSQNINFQNLKIISLAFITIGILLLYQPNFLASNSDKSISSLIIVGMTSINLLLICFLLWRTFRSAFLFELYNSKSSELQQQINANLTKLDEKWFRLLKITFSFLLVITFFGFFIVSAVGTSTSNKSKETNLLRLKNIEALLTNIVEGINAHGLMISKMPEILSAAQHPNSPNLKTASTYLQRYCRTLENADCHLISLQGQLIASSEEISDEFNIPELNSETPYFKLAYLGMPAQQFAVSQHKKEMTLFVSHPVRSSNGFIIGIVIIRLGIKDIETQLYSLSPVFITDRKGVILLTNYPEYRLTCLWPLNSELIEEIKKSRLYDGLFKSAFLLDEKPENNQLINFNGNSYFYQTLSSSNIEGITFVRLESTQSVSINKAIALILIWSIVIIILISLAFTHHLLTIGKITLIRKIISDNERSEIQIKLHHSDKLASIGMLAAGVAHEINNPLNIILFYAESIKDKVTKLTGESLINHIQESQDRQITAIKRISTIVKGLCTYARSDVDYMDKVDLRQIIDDTITLVIHIYKKLNIEIVVKHEADNSYIIGNTGKLQQVIMNLLSNSKDALKEKGGGEIRILTKNIDNKIVLIIADNGSGISKDSLPKLFQPFFTTKPVGLGTGLGLSISHSIILEHNGTITVDSEVEFGTAFTIFLPIFNKEQQNKVHANKEQLTEFKLQGKLLLVDDEEEIRKNLSSILTNFGLEVQCESDGLSAYERLKKEEFDFIITDIKMPRMDGTELIQKALTLPNFKSKIIVITAGIVTDYPSEQRNLIRKYAQGYLTKPFSAMAIYKLLQRIS